MSTAASRAADPAGPVTLVHAGYVVPVRPRGQVLEAHTVALRGNRIAAILPRDEALARWPDADQVERPGHALLPGLVNAHTHAPMTLLRGYADDMALTTWLQEHIWPAEQRHVGPDFVREGTRLAVAEMLRSGTTCFNDMYFFPDATIDVCREVGMRASVGITIIEFASAWASGVDSYIEKGLELLEAWGEEPLLRFTLSPHSPYTVSDDTLARIAALSRERDLPVHMHLLETEWEIKQSYQQHDQHPVSRLERHGLLNERLQAVHMVHTSAEDIAKIAGAGASVVHCPQSNLKLASGFCPVGAMLDAGINVAIGTDGAASNNDLDLLAETQTAALLAKAVAGDARVLDAGQALEMMTLNGARALGMAQEIGSIEAGKQADLIAIDLETPATQPLHNVVSQLLYAASGGQVTDVWVAGRRVLNSGRLTTIDEAEVLASAGRWRERLAEADTA